MSEVKGQNTQKTLKTTILQATLKFICKKYIYRKKHKGAKLLKLQQQPKRKLERKGVWSGTKVTARNQNNTNAPVLQPNLTFVLINTQSGSVLEKVRL